MFIEDEPLDNLKAQQFDCDGNLRPTCALGQTDSDKEQETIRLGARALEDRFEQKNSYQNVNQSDKDEVQSYLNFLLIHQRLNQGCQKSARNPL